MEIILRLACTNQFMLMLCSTKYTKVVLPRISWGDRVYENLSAAKLYISVSSYQEEEGAPRYYMYYGNTSIPKEAGMK